MIVTAELSYNIDIYFQAQESQKFFAHNHEELLTDLSETESPLQQIGLMKFEAFSKLLIFKGDNCRFYLPQFCEECEIT